jgi:hypothetical protein
MESTHMVCSHLSDLRIISYVTRSNILLFLSFVPLRPYPLFAPPPSPPLLPLHLSILVNFPSLPNLHTSYLINSGGSGSLDIKSSFLITDAAAFTEFSSYMLNAETFVWHLSGKLDVKALGHTVKDLNLEKDITVNGE